MPTLPERMAVVEVEIASIKTTTTDTNADVKELLAWRDEERGARAQRGAYIKYIALALTILTIVVNVAMRFV